MNIWNGIIFIILLMLVNIVQGIIQEIFCLQNVMMCINLLAFILQLINQVFL